MNTQDHKLVVVAGATGHLGKTIVHHLITRGARVRALVRHGSDEKAIQSLTGQGAQVVEVNYDDRAQLAAACSHASCVVSALSGLRDVIVTAQTNLLNAAVDAGVPRFIPSDYCIDYNPLHPGDNRNLDLRREFSAVLSAANIAATSVLNGMFTDLLTGQAPVVLLRQKRIFTWGNVDQKMDFTTLDNTAEYTAAAALDTGTPRWLRIAGDESSMRDIKQSVSELTGKHFKFLRPGGLGAFKVVIKLTKTFSPGKQEVFPAWQGMQYLYDMLSGLPKFGKLDNDRYAGIRWFKIKDVMDQFLSLKTEQN